MFLDKLKANANSWLQNEKYMDSYKESVIEQYLNVSSQIEAFWINDESYIKTQSEVNTLKVVIEISQGDKENELKELRKLLMILSSIKKLIISQEYNQIYALIKIIHSIQRKYLDLGELIGKPANLDEILGQNGYKLKEKNKIALDYVDELIQISELLKIEKSNIKARESRRDANKLIK